MNAIKSMLCRSDSVYDAYAARCQATSVPTKAVYLFMHLAPGLFAVLLLNVEPIYFFARDLTGLDDRSFQYAMFIFVTFGWHMLLPVIVLHSVDKLTWRETIDCIGLTRFDWKGCFVVLPLIMIPYTLLAVPYYMWVAPPFRAWLESIPAFQLPEYSIFENGLYDYPPIMLLFLFVGNFLGEETYYRGYLMKKCAFLGGHTWWVTSMLFAIYHFWQIPHTWPHILPVVIFGLMMQLRKDIYVVIIFHAFLNLAWFNIVDGIIDWIS